MDIGHAEQVLTFQTNIQAHSELKERLKGTLDLQGASWLTDILEENGTLQETLIGLGRQAKIAMAAADKMNQVIQDKLAEKNYQVSQFSRLREIILWSMVKTNQDKIKAPGLSLLRRTASLQLLLITDGALIPKDLCEVRYVPNKGAIKAMLAQGREVPGVTLLPTKPSLLIR